MYLPKVVMVMVVFYGYISIILSAAVPALSSQNYGSNNFDSRRSNLLATPRNLPRTSPSSSGYTHDVVPKPYKFNYFIVDDQGNTHHRDEESNGNGTVKGYYGYTDISGLFRIVEYTADRNGFRVSIKTNEPTLVGRKSPADVRLNDYPSSSDMRNENEPWKYSGSCYVVFPYGICHRQPVDKVLDFKRLLFQ
ncbi:cuticle protein 14-like [Argiope bruennichi]|uniref:cuticle protein 14-like n=1 Tax=Argiope bruennichi TaxID=94029 RepID=UPI0024951114|nr:cuticle protein 14-like [Argiope bruennichi]